MNKIPIRKNFENHIFSLGHFVVEPKTISVIDYPGLRCNCTVKIEKYQNVDIKALNLCREVLYDRSVIVKQDGEFLKIVLQKYGCDLSIEEDPREIPINETYWCYLGLDVLITVFLAPVLDKINIHNFMAGGEILKPLELFPKLYLHMARELENTMQLIKLVYFVSKMDINNTYGYSNGNLNLIPPRNLLELGRFHPKNFVNPEKFCDVNQSIETLSKVFSNQNRQDSNFGLLVNWAGILTDEENSLSHSDFIGNIAILVYRVFRNVNWSKKIWENHMHFLVQMCDMAIENANRKATVSSAFIQTHKAWRIHQNVWALWAIISIILIWAIGEDYEFYGISEKSRALILTKTEGKSRIYYSGKRVRIPIPNFDTNPIQVIDNAYYEIFHDSF